MDAWYGIFKNDPAGALWVECVRDPNKITERLKHLNDDVPGEYFAYDFLKAQIIARIPAEDPGIGHAYDLFKEDEQGERIWVETIIGLHRLKKRLLKLSSVTPGAYSIYDPAVGRFVEPFKKSA